MKQTTNILNSYILEVGNTHVPEERKKSGVYTFENLSVSTNFETTSSWLNVENSDYALWLDGHFYLKNSSTMNLRFNLTKLLMEMTENSYNYARTLISGGVFILLVLDKRHKRLIVSGDTGGLSPLFYRQGHGNISLSSHQFNLSDAENMSDTAVLEYLKFGYLPFSHSFYDDIKRLLPGQTLNISLDTMRLNLSAPQLPQYRPEEERVTNTEEAAEALRQAFKSYFTRFSRSNYLIGLSGVYDPELLVEWLGNYNPHLISLDRPSLEEVGLDSESIRSCDIFNKFGRDLSSRFRVVGNLENVHMLSLIERIRSLQPDYYLDGYMDQGILSCTNHMDIEESQDELRSYPWLESDFRKPIQASHLYEEFLYKSRDSVDDRQLEGLISDDLRDNVTSNIRKIVMEHRQVCHTHDDLAESLNQFTRGRSLLAAAPVSLGAFTVAASPFSDDSIREICLGLDRVLRTREHWQNYYRKKFRKNGTSRGSEIYRQTGPKWKRVYHSIVKKTIFPDLDRHDMRGDLRQVRKSLREVLHEAKKDQFVEKLLQGTDSRIPSFVPRGIDLLHRGDALDDRLLLRYLSLSYYISGDISSLSLVAPPPLDLALVYFFCKTSR